jgi:hypothetical protein
MFEGGFFFFFFVCVDFVMNKEETMFILIHTHAFEMQWCMLIINKIYVSMNYDVVVMKVYKDF